MLADTPERLDWLRMAQARGRYLGHAHGDHLHQGGQGDQPAAGGAVLRRRAVRRGRGQRRPLRRHPRLRDLRPQPRRRGVHQHVGHRVEPTHRRHVGRDHRPRPHHPRRARRQLRRVVGPRGRTDGRARAAGAGDGAPLPDDRADARGDRVQPANRPRAAAHDRLRRRDLLPARRARASCSARTSRTTGRGRRTRRRGTSSSSSSPTTSTASPPSWSKAFEHFPLVGKAGIQKFVNGPFTFSPDGNPLVGPIKGMRGMWVACAVMAGLSQGGGVGLSLANWMVARRPRRRHLGDGRRPLRRLRHTRLHQRQGPRELLASVPHHLPQRGTARRPSAAHHPDLRPPHRPQRRVGRRVRAWSTRCGSRSPVSNR